jgi:hypothetical protein
MQGLNPWSLCSPRSRSNLGQKYSVLKLKMILRNHWRFMWICAQSWLQV